MEFLKGDGARTGLFFGATSGVITTIGLIVGLNSGTRSITAVLGGILVIAVADAMSDALGIHLAEESDPATSHDHVWAATITTFVTKFVFSISDGIGGVGDARHCGPELFPGAHAERVSLGDHRGTHRYRRPGCRAVSLHRRLGKPDVRLAHQDNRWPI